MTHLKRTTTIALLAGAVALLASSVPGCSGSREDGSSASSSLNYNGNGGGAGNKALNLSGYEYVDSTHINIYFNHQSTLSVSEIDASMFTVRTWNWGVVDPVSDITVASGTNMSGTNATNLNKGTRVGLTLADDLSNDTQYYVDISGLLTNDNGLSIGNYMMDGSGFTFVFRTPTDVSCTDDCVWSNTTPAVRYEVNTAYAVPYENNVVVVFDRPIKPSTLSTFLSNLNSNFKYGPSAPYDPVILDTNNSTGHSAVANAEGYTAKSNNVGATSYVNTTFYFPMFVNGTSFPVYNRYQGARHYVLTLPSFTDISDNTFASPDTLQFTGVTGDLPGWLDTRPTATAGASSGDLDVSWSPTSLGTVGATTQYDVYYATATSTSDTTNKWKTSAYSKTGSCYTTGTPPATSCTIHGLTTSTYYYVRVVPSNSVGRVGYSLSNVTPVRPKQ